MKRRDREAATFIVRSARAPYLSVSFSSMRRLRLKASSVVPGSIGWNSPKPAATRRCGGTPLLIRYCTTEMARAADSSQFDLNGDVAEICRRIGVAVDAQHPVDLRRNLLLQIEQRAGELVEFGAAFRPQHRGAAVEEDLRLEHEAVADDADVGAVAEDFAQLAEEIRPVARQFLHALRQRDVKALAEIGDDGAGIPSPSARRRRAPSRARRSGGAAR